LLAAASKKLLSAICPDSIAANVQSVELIPLNAGNQIERVVNAHGAFHTSTAVIVEYF
jgi:hypothetical protein